jgi:hypothetical protein
MFALTTKGTWLVADGQLVSILSQFLYAKRTLSPVRLVLMVTLFLLLHCTGVFLCFWGVLTRLDLHVRFV